MKIRTININEVLHKVVKQYARDHGYLMQKALEELITLGLKAVEENDRRS